MEITVPTPVEHLVSKEVELYALVLTFNSENYSSQLFILQLNRACGSFLNKGDTNVSAVHSISLINDADFI